MTGLEPGSPRCWRSSSQALRASAAEKRSLGELRSKFGSWGKGEGRGMAHKCCTPTTCQPSHGCFTAHPTLTLSTTHSVDEGTEAQKRKGPCPGPQSNKPGWAAREPSSDGWLRVGCGPLPGADRDPWAPHGDSTWDSPFCVLDQVWNHRQASHTVSLGVRLPPTAGAPPGQARWFSQGQCLCRGDGHWCERKSYAP